MLAPCLRQGTRIVTNMGAANPEAAGREIRRLARDAGLGPVPCAVVTGDDVLEINGSADKPCRVDGKKVAPPVLPGRRFWLGFVLGVVVTAGAVILLKIVGLL